MDLERARRQAELATAKNHLATIVLQGDVDLVDLRNATDPLLKDSIIDMDWEQAGRIMARIKGLVERGRELSAKIIRLEEALGAR